MRYWLARTLREMRGDEPRLDVVAYMRERGCAIAESTLKRFEEEEPGPGRTEGFPEAIDAIVAGYAAKWGDGEPPRRVWLRAWVAWIEQGGAPYVGEITPDVLAALAAVEGEERLLIDQWRRRGVAGLPEATNTTGARRKFR